VKINARSKTRAFLVSLSVTQMNSFITLNQGGKASRQVHQRPDQEDRPGRGREEVERRAHREMGRNGNILIKRALHKVFQLTK